MDNLTICPCQRQSDACYMQEVSPEIKNYMCYGCGFISNSLMKEGERFYEEQVEVLPELYKDLFWTDDDGKIWMPSVVNEPTKGMVFANGPSSSNWMWGAVQAVPVKDEEKEKYPIPGKKDQYYQFRMDMTTLKNFDKFEFIEALSYIGVLPE
jgi:hypothetical protein